jgi:hypothetical protein
VPAVLKGRTAGTEAGRYIPDTYPDPIHTLVRYGP